MSIQPERLPHILDGPAETSPDGVYHLDNPPNRNVLGLVAAGLCMAIATIVVMLRVYSRLFFAKKIRVEDGTCINHTTLIKAVCIENLS